MFVKNPGVKPSELPTDADRAAAARAADEAALHDRAVGENPLNVDGRYIVREDGTIERLRPLTGDTGGGCLW